MQSPKSLEVPQGGRPEGKSLQGETQFHITGFEDKGSCECRNLGQPWKLGKARK